MTWTEKAQRRFPDASVNGWGPVAVVTSFARSGTSSVRLYPDLEQAERYRNHVDRQLRRMRKPSHSFKIVDLREEGGEL